MPDRRFMEIARALGDESRVRSLLALRHGELCVCQIIGLLGLAPSTVSKHLTILKQAGLVEARKQGRWMYYRLAADDAGDEFVGRTMDWLIGTVGQSAQARAEDKRLKKICRMDPELLCERQREGIWAACLPNQDSACCAGARNGSRAGTQSSQGLRRERGARKGRS